jgi:hypothetical protein
MTTTEISKLHTIVAKIENLQNATSDAIARERLQVAKSELLRLLTEIDTRG